LVLAKLLEVIPSLNELAGKIETMNQLVPARSLKSVLDSQRLEVLSGIDRAKCQAIRVVLRELSEHGQRNDHQI
jgi:hypothetical protein